MNGRSLIRVRVFSFFCLKQKLIGKAFRNELVENIYLVVFMWGKGSVE